MGLTGNEIYGPQLAQAIEFRSLIDSFTKTAIDATAATATGETLVGVVHPTLGGSMAYVYYVPAAALTSNANDYATILVQKRTAGGAAVTIATVTTQTTAAGGSGNWAAWAPVLIPLSSAAAALLTALDALTFSITKSGNGVAVPAGTLCLFAG